MLVGVLVIGSHQHGYFHHQFPTHNMIQLHNNIMWDWQYSMEKISEYSMEYCHSHKTLLWIWIMVCNANDML